MKPFHAGNVEKEMAGDNISQTMTRRNTLPTRMKGSSSGSAAQRLNLGDNGLESGIDISTSIPREQQLEGRLAEVMQKLEAIEAAIQFPAERSAEGELVSSEGQGRGTDWSDRPPDYVSQAGETAHASRLSPQRH